MIERYSPLDIADIWKEEYKFRIWLNIEILNLEGWAKIGKIPQRVALSVKKRAKFNIEEIKEIEKRTKHDVVAFISAVSKHLNKQGKTYFHYGLTSSDIVDTANSYRLKKATNLLIKRHRKLKNNLKKLSLKYKDTIQVGRTHGVHAEPITLGFKFAGFYAESLRNEERLKRALEEISFGKLSGSCGNYLHISPRVEAYVMNKLGLKVEPHSTQVIPRDRYASYLNTLALVAASIERIALQVRLLHQTEISEVMEPFAPTQKGSSSMPHKKNPIMSERIMGLSRLLRGYAGVALENIPLWHERDISHSSVERVILPDATLCLGYIYDKIIHILENIQVFPDNIKNNLGRSMVSSQKILYKLIEKGLNRDKAYEIVQRIALSGKFEIEQEIPEVKKIFSEGEFSQLKKEVIEKTNRVFKRLGLI